MEGHSGVCGLGVPGDGGSAPSQRGTKPLCPHVQAESSPARPPAGPETADGVGGSGEGGSGGAGAGKIAN